MIHTDSIAPWVLFISIGFASIAYALRVMTKGRAHYDRIERQGSSAFLSKGVMEMAYWAIQPLAELLVYLRVTANGLSYSSVLFGFLAAVALVYGHFGTASVLAAVAAIFDALDGLVARLTNSTSLSGKVLDSSLDRYVEFFFISGLVIYYREVVPFQILALTALLASFMVSYTTALAEIMQMPIPRGSMRRPERLVYLVLGAALSPLSIVYFERELALPVNAGYPMLAALVLVSVVGNLSAISRLRAIMREMDQREERLRAERIRVEQEQLSDEGKVLRFSSPGGRR